VRQALLTAAALLVALCLPAPTPAAAPPEPLTIYSSLPLVGDARPQSEDIVRAEVLAVEQNGRHPGGFSIKFVSLDDATRRAGKWTPSRTAANARRAAADPTAIAYLGEFNSGATAISLPILNEAGILQVSPSNTYVGLTRAEGAEPGEPEKYYPAGYRTFGRLTPPDHLQAAAVAALLQAERVKRVFLVDDREVYGRGLGVIDAFRATRDRDSVLGRYSIDENGDTTLATYGVLKVSRRGRPAYDRTIDSSR